MNYFGKLDAKVSDALGQHPSAHLYSETVHANHVPADAIVVPDAQLLFGADFKRAGVDLVLSGEGREVVLHDYFKGEHRAAIASPDGAHLTGDLVTALAGDVQYAQADGNNADVHKVIGHVTKLVGSATAMRNGVSIILNNGDNVEKGDVVSSGADSTLGITFIDGTVFGLSSNARMVLNEMVYDPNGSNNSSLLSLVAGTITFVAGETAKHGDMKVDTPVATMGIRGTAVLVEIDFSVPGATPDAKFQVLVEPDGTTGSYILFDKTTLTPLAVVDRAGTQINISNGIMSQTLAPLSPEIQKLINDVFTLKFTDNSNTKSLDHFTDSIIPTDGLGLFKFAGLNNNAPTIPVIVNLVVAESSNSGPGASTKNHIPEAPSFQTGPVAAFITEQPNQTGLKQADLISGQIQYFDVNTTDHDTLSVKFSSFTYLNAKGQDVSSSLNSLQLKDIANVEASIGVVEPLTPDAGGNATATWSYSVADKNFDFLAAGETLTLTYTATVDNNFQAVDQVSTPQTFTITITGTNDVPVITSSQQNIQFIPSGTDTKGGELIPDTATTGKLAFTDPDLTDTHTVSVKMASALLDGKDLSATVGQVVIDELGSALTAKITAADDSTGTGAGTIEWTLADLQVYLADVVPANETLVLTYAVTVTDSQGATDTQNIVVTIGGNQPAATVWIDTTPIPSDGVALWSDAANWESDRAPTINDDVFIGTDQMLPNTPVFPATVDADAQAKSLTMDYFTDFGTSIPELDVDKGVTLTIAGDLKLDTSTDSTSPLTAETIIKNWGTISVGAIAELLKHSVIENYGTLTLNGGGEFADQSSITNSGTIEIASDTLAVAVDIINSVTTTAGSAGDGVVANAATVTTDGLIQVDTGATLRLEDGGGIIGGNLKIASDGIVEITYGQDGSASANGGILDGVHVTNDGTIQVDGAVAADPTTTPATLATPAATLTLDDGTAIIGGNLTIADGAAVDVEAGAIGPGATLDGVTVTGTGGDTPSTIEIGNSGAATLLLDDGTAIISGNLTIAGGSTLDVEAGTAGPGATLDGVTVTGADATESVSASTIEIGNSGAATLLLDDGTTITNGNLNIANGSTLDVEAGTTDPGATLDGVTVTGTNATESEAASTIEVGASGPATLLLDDGTTIANGDLTISAGSAIDVEAGKTGPGATLDGVAVSGTGGDNPSTIAVGGSSVATLVLEGGTAITNGDLNIAGGSTLDIEAGNTGPGATLDGVTVNGADAASDPSVPASTIEVGNSGAATLLLDDGTTITGGDLTIASASTVDVESIDGATLDGVTVSGTNDPSTIEIGNSGAATLLLDDGTTITNGNLTIGGGGTLDVESAASGPGATLDGVAVSGTSGDSASIIEIGVLGAATLLLDDGTTVKNGNLNIVGGSTLDVEAGTAGPGATLDGVTVHGTDAIDMIAASTIEVGNSGAATLLLDDGTTIANGNLTIGSGSTLDVESAGGATLNGVAVSNAGTIKVDGEALDPTTVTLVLDGGTKITGGKLLIKDPLSSDEGIVEIKSGGATFDDVTVTNNNELIIDSLVTLTLTDNTSILGGTIDDKGTLLISSASELENTTVSDGGDVTVTGGTLTLSGVTLDDVTLSGSFTNADTLTVDDTVTLNGATLSGGTIDDAGTLNVTAASEIESATVDGGGNITATTAALTLSGVTLDDVTLSGSFTNADTLTIDDAVTLDGATISGGTIDDTGTLSVTAASEIENATVDGGGDITATAAALTLSGVTLDDVTLSGSFTNADTLTIDDAVTLDGATISGGTIDDTGTLSVTAASEIENATVDGGGDITATAAALTLSGVTLDDVTLAGSFTNADTLTIDDAVTLDGATISGGTIDDTGTLSVTAASEIENATVDGGGDITATAAALTLSGVTLDDVTLAGSFTNADSLTVDDSVTLNGATVSGGTIDDTGTLKVTAASEIENATVDGGGDLTATAAALTLSGVTLDDVTLAGSFTNADTLTIDDTVTLNGATLSGGTIDDTGTLKVTAASEIENATVDGGGDITATAAALTLSKVTLDDVTLAGSFTNADTLTIDDTVTLNGATLSGGTIDDTGTLKVTAASEIENATVDGGGDITATAAALTLSGVTLDDVTLSGSFTNADTLTIDDTVTLNGATISGGTIDDTGTLNVTAASELENTTVDGGGDITATEAALTLSGVTLDDVTLSGSFTNADTLTIDDTVTLNGATISGGTIDDTGTLNVTAASELENTTVDGGGDITATAAALTLSGVTLDDVTLAGSFTNADTLTIDDTVTLNGATVSGGTIDDAGTLSVSSASEIENATIDGGGDITATVAALTLSGVTLDDVTLSGSFTADTLTIDDTVTLNGATVSGGTIDDTGTLKVTAASEIENATVDGGGNLTATSAALTLSGVTLDDVTLAGSFTNADTLTIDDTVTLNGATVSGGTIDDTGTLKVTAASEIENATVDGGGNLTATSAALTLSGVTLDDVTLAGNFTNADTLTIDDTVTLNGATISGGTIDDTGTLKVTAASEIENATVNGGGDVTVTGGILTLSGVTLDDVTLAGNFTNADTLTIDDTVTLNGADIAGGTLDISGTLDSTGVSFITGATIVNSGNINVVSGTLKIDPATFTNTGTVDVESGSTLVLSGETVTNSVTSHGITTNGLIQVDAASQSSLGTLDLEGGSTISGGTITVAGVLNSTGSGATVSNFITNATIDNSGTLESTVGTLTISGGSITNSGILDANFSTLDITSDPITNTGKLEATLFGSVLTLTDLTVTNTGGTVSVDFGAFIDLAGSTVSGGTIDIDGTLNSTGTSFITNAAITNSEFLESTGGTLTISGGSIANSDILEANGGALDITSDPIANTRTLEATDNSVLTLTTLTVTNTGTSASVSDDLGSTIDLAGSTISSGLVSIAGKLDSTGSSFITNATMINQATGTLESTDGTLTISGGSITNSGTLEANGGALDITGDPIANTGTLQAIDNSVLTLTNLTVTNTGGTVSDALGSTIDLASSTISGGTVNIAGTLDATGTNSITGATIINSGNINVVNGTLTIDPAPFTNTGIVDVQSGSTLVLSNQAVTNSVTTGKTTANGQIKVDAASSTNFGTLDLKGSTINGGLLAIAGLLASTGSSAIAGTAITNTGTIDVQSDTLVLSAETVTNSVTSGQTTTSGLIQVDAASLAHFGTLDLEGSTINGGSLTIAGILDSTGTSAIAGAAITNTGTIESSSGTLTIDPGTFTNTGTVDVQSDSTFVLSGESITNSVTSGETTTNGLIQVDAASSTHFGTLDLEGSTINGGSLTIAGVLDSTGTSAITVATITNTGTIDVQNGTLTITGNITNGTSTGTGTIEIDAGAHLEITGTVTGQTVDFTAPNGAGELILDNPYGFKGVISGLVEATSGHSESAENFVDLKGFTDTTGTKVVSAVFNSATDVTAVTITNGTSQSNLTIDLHGNYSRGDIEFATDHHGGTLFSDPAADSGTVTIDNGITLDIGGASSATINFTNSTGNTGELVLGDSHDFTGTIAGFAGDGTIANSDLIDATDINFANVATDKTTYTENAAGTGGTLTLFDANGHALDSLNFTGNYQLANFTIENDGQGGTLIVDPPVNTNSPAPASTVVASAANQTLSGTAPSENFVFNFPSVGQSTVSNFHAATDTLQFGTTTFADAQAALNAVHDDGHGNSVLVIDAHDSITLTGVLKAQLHVNDFHIV